MAMKRLILGAAILPAILLCSAVMAQDVDKLPKPGDQLQPSDDITQSEDMWFYLQELRRYDDPQVMIRRKAELKGQQRRQRLAAMKWFGWSQGRPTANPTPSMGYYSPSWLGNGSNPHLWVGNAYVRTTVRLDTAVRSTTATKTR
jgi:hypothetical protein